MAGFLSGAAKILPADTVARNFSAPQGQTGGQVSVPDPSPAAGAAQDVALEGELSVAVEDRSGGSRKVYAVDTDSGRYNLRFASEPAGLKTGMRVRVTGALTGAEVSVAPGPDGLAVARETGVGVEAASALGGTLGAWNTAVILVNFPNNTTQPYTTATARNIVFTGTSNFDLENSYGQTWLTGNVFGWYTISLNLSATTCDYATMTTLGNQARAAATAAGVNLSGYTHFVYGFPNTAACGCTILKSLSTTVATPRKCPGRKRPSSLLATDGGSTMNTCGCWYICPSSG